MTSTSASHAEGHHPFQAHHFESGEQQFQAGKLGMWLFLVTEVLFFSGMFCAYAVYRARHPEIFEHSSKFLDTYLGAANTLVLLASSLTVAWGVRCAQLNNKVGLVYNLVFTLVCAGFFLGVKAVEYTLKFYEGLYWRSSYSEVHPTVEQFDKALGQLTNFGLVLLCIGAAFVALGYLLGGESAAKRWTFWAIGATILGAGSGSLIGQVYADYTMREDIEAHAHDHDHEHAEGHDAHADGEHVEGEHAEGEHDDGDAAHAESETEHGESESDESTEGEDAAAATSETESTDTENSEAEAAKTTETSTDAAAPTATPAVLALDADDTPTKYDGYGDNFPGIFFSIYYAMTGIHAIHILCGIGVIVWIVARSAAGHFGPDYYGPVEYVGLYWHLVDLIWIYLFPLLYLI